VKKKLSEGKFRWINEQLYTITGSKALEMFQENPQLFDEVKCKLNIFYKFYKIVNRLVNSSTSLIVS
jgi:hypothetical protein